MENMLKIYAIKFFVLISFLSVLYVVTMIAEGKSHVEWSTTGATVFYIVSCFLLIHVTTYNMEK